MKTIGIPFPAQPVTISAQAQGVLGPLSSIFGATFILGGVYLSTSNAKGTGTSVSCPVGGIRCGSQVVSSMVWLSGTIWKWMTHCGTTVCAGADTYNITSPQLVDIAGQGEQPLQSFRACYVTGSKVPMDGKTFCPSPDSLTSNDKNLCKVHSVKRRAYRMILMTGRCQRYSQSSSQLSLPTPKGSAPSFQSLFGHNSRPHACQPPRHLHVPGPDHHLVYQYAQISATGSVSTVSA